MVPAADLFSNSCTALEETKSELGQSARHLDILKVDVEGAEWELLNDLLGRPGA